MSCGDEMICPPPGKSGPGMPGEQDIVIDIRIAHQLHGGGCNFAQVVRGNFRRHADRDARCAIEQHHRQARREHRGFLECAVVVGHEVHRAHVDFGQQQIGQRREARLGVAHRRRVVAVAGAEVALSVHQRIAQREVLRQAHHGFVGGRIAMRMIFAQYVADHARRFDVFAAVVQPHRAHGVEYATLHRLLAVAYVRQGTAFDHGDGIFQIGAFGILRDRHIIAVRQRGQRGELPCAAVAAPCCCRFCRYFRRGVLCIRKEAGLVFVVWVIRVVRAGRIIAHA